MNSNGVSTTDNHSRSFPFLRVTDWSNHVPRNVLAGNVGGTRAFFVRLEIIGIIGTTIQARGWAVSDDCMLIVPSSDIRFANAVVRNAISTRYHLTLDASQKDLGVHDAES